MVNMLKRRVPNTIFVTGRKSAETLRSCMMLQFRSKFTRYLLELLGDPRDLRDPWATPHDTSEVHEKLGNQLVSLILLKKKTKLRTDH